MTRPSGSTLIVAASTAPDFGRYSGYPYSTFAVDSGGLMAYDIIDADLHRRAATYVDRILEGAKPSDLAVQQPTQFKLVINMKTAKALELTIPQCLLVRADSAFAIATMIPS